MTIRNVIHRGLRRFMERNDASGLSPPVVEKVRNIVTFLPAGDGGCSGTPRHSRLEGSPARGEPQRDLELTVTRNWRITFGIDQARKEVFDLDHEDYH